MGEIADAMISGLFCQYCGVLMDDHDEPGFPRSCSGCDGIAGPDPQKRIEHIAKSRKSRKRRRAKDRKELVRLVIANAQPRVRALCSTHPLCGDVCLVPDINALLREVLAEYRVKVNEAKP